MRVTRTAGTALVLLVVLAVDAVGTLAWVGKAVAAPRIGTVTGTAAPCVGLPPSVGETWKVDVTMRHGTKVIGMRTVTDSLRVGRRLAEGHFTFTEPAGTYVVKTAAATQTVVIKPGETVTVALRDDCD